MTQPWDVDDIIDRFTLLPPEMAFLGSHEPHNLLGKALLLKFFQAEGRFPESEADLSPAAIEYVAQQLNVPANALQRYDWDGRRSKTQRGEIRALLGFRRTGVADQAALRQWLVSEVLPGEHRPVYLTQLAYGRLRQLHLEPPTSGRMERLVASAVPLHEQAFFTNTAAQLPEGVKTKLRQLVYKKEELAEHIDLGEKEEDDPSQYPINDLKSGAGAAKVKNIKKVADRLKLLQEVGLPPALFACIPLRFSRQYQQQAAVEAISHLQRHENEAQTETLLAAFCWVRQREITDQLELFIQILNDIRLRAKQHVEQQLLADFIRVGGKQQLLYRLAEVMWDNPDGIIGEILYPVVGKERLQSLVHEAKHQGTYRRSVQTRISGSYNHHYRQMLPPLLEVLTFRSNNEQYQPLIKALQVVAAYLQESDPFYPVEEDVPLEGVDSETVAQLDIPARSTRSSTGAAGTVRTVCLAVLTGKVALQGDLGGRG